MKQIIIVLMCWVSLSGCRNASQISYASQQIEEPSTTTIDVEKSTLAAQGTVGGGGGNTLTDPPKVSPAMIKEAAISAKLPISVFLNEEEKKFLLFNTGRNSNWKTTSPKLFGNPQRTVETSVTPNSTDGEVDDIFKVIEKIKIEIRENADCYDDAQNPVDGSFSSKMPDSICISAFRLSKKLNPFNYEYETAALVIHELSHALGTTESEATSLQASYAGVMYSYNVATLQSHRRKFLNALEDISHRLPYLTYLYPKVLPDIRDIFEIGTKFWEIEGLTAQQEDFSPIRAATYESLQYEFYLFRFLTEFLSSDPKIESSDTYSSENYEKFDVYKFAVESTGELLPNKRFETWITRKPRSLDDVYETTGQIRSATESIQLQATDVYVKGGVDPKGLNTVDLF